MHEIFFGFYKYANVTLLLRGKAYSNLSWLSAKAKLKQLQYL